MSAKRSARGTFFEVDDCDVGVDGGVVLRGGVGGGPRP